MLRVLRHVTWHVTELDQALVRVAGSFLYKCYMLHNNIYVLTNSFLYINTGILILHVFLERFSILLPWTHAKHVTKTCLLPLRARKLLILKKKIS